jgi:hypothetical protein
MAAHIHTEVAGVLWQQEVHCRVHSSPPLDPVSNTVLVHKLATLAPGFHKLKIAQY